MNDKLYWLTQCARTIADAQEGASRLARARGDASPAALDAVRIRLAVLRSEIEAMIGGRIRDGLNEKRPNRSDISSQTPWPGPGSED